MAMIMTKSTFDKNRQKRKKHKTSETGNTLRGKEHQSTERGRKITSYLKVHIWWLVEPKTRNFRTKMERIKSKIT